MACNLYFNMQKERNFYYLGLLLESLVKTNNEI